MVVNRNWRTGSSSSRATSTATSTLLAVVTSMTLLLLQICCCCLDGTWAFIHPSLSSSWAATAGSMVAVRNSLLLASSTNEISSSSAPNAAVVVPSVPIPPWYSDPKLSRDRSDVIGDGGFDYHHVDGSQDSNKKRRRRLSKTMLDVLSRPTARIIPFQGNAVFVRRIIQQQSQDEGGSSSDNGHYNKIRDPVEPLYLRYEECGLSWFDDQKGGSIAWLGRGQRKQQQAEKQPPPSGNKDNELSDDDDDDDECDYFAIDIPSDIDVTTFACLSSSSSSTSDNEDKKKTNDNGNGDDIIIESSTVRSYGDRMSLRTDAALVATANGLLTFHRTHGYCSRCGTPTRQIKAGSARKCTSDSCRTSVYPRIDPAVIMLVTSPCRQYALLGRKQSWPSGRYSTLAGFTEVGETFEECVVRETKEESGIDIDPKSIRFIASQPWPFPRSVMVGFHATAANPTTTTGGPSDSDRTDNNNLPIINFDPNEMEDVQWFEKQYVREYGLIEGKGSSALDFIPDAEEAEFHVPGPASLARLLITEWVKQSD